MQSTRFQTFAAVALAGIGDLPETVMDRSVVLRMKRRRPEDQIRRWRFKFSEPEGAAIAARLSRYAGTVVSLPEVEDDPTIQDRAFDVWEPLFSIAEEAGGTWPQDVRLASHAITVDTPLEDVSLALRVIVELRDIWPADESWVSTTELLRKLYELEDSIWSDNGEYPFERGLSARKLALFLKKYDIHPTRSSQDKKPRGYFKSAIDDACLRWAPLAGEPVQLVKLSEKPSKEVAEPVQLVQEPQFDPMELNEGENR